MWRWFKWVLLSIGILIGIIVLFFLQPWAFLPHKHIEMSLPFAPEDDAYTHIIPLGEKIEHNKSNGTPDGHPGIDFGWDKETKILSVSDGRVMGVSTDKSGKYNITVISGYYKIVYKEMNKIEAGFKFFSKVKKGQLLGYSGTKRTNSDKPKESDPSGQIHWDFGSASFAIDRLCPVNYFDAESKARLLKIWEGIPSSDIFKKQYPEICNGIFKGKED